MCLRGWGESLIKSTLIINLLNQKTLPKPISLRPFWSRFSEYPAHPGNLLLKLLMNNENSTYSYPPKKAHSTSQKHIFHFRYPRNGIVVLWYLYGIQNTKYLVSLYHEVMKIMHFFQAPPSLKTKPTFLLLKGLSNLLCAFISGSFKHYILRNAWCIPLVIVLNLNTWVPFSFLYFLVPLKREHILRQ